MLMTNTGEDLYEATGRAHAIRPDFAFAALEGGSHDIIDEQPQNWARTVIEFLRR
jgi:pimeloyl-ACP methyl ester carboxylesterase